MKRAGPALTQCLRQYHHAGIILLVPPGGNPAPLLARCKERHWTPASVPVEGTGRGGDIRHAFTSRYYFFISAHFDSATVVKAWSPGMVATTFM